jgi:RNA-directed DNA polymerase
MKGQIVTKLRHWITQLIERQGGRALSSIHHKMDMQLLLEAHRHLEPNKAPGIDGVSKEQYSRGLQANLEDLLKRVKTQTYRAPAVRRVEIPKPDGKTRPLGVPTHEDKVLQKAFVELVEPIFEREFHDGSYGYRPRRTQHDAVRVLHGALSRGNHYVVELDIKGYFDSIPHDTLRQMFNDRITDGVLNRLILGWLKAGVMKEGEWQESESGTPQGGVVSPLLANLYLHEVLDKWVEEQVKPKLKGGVKLVRYADDAVLSFSQAEDAQRFYAVLGKRFEKYGLKLHPEKTRLIDFRPPASGEGERRTFSFLGFTYYWGKSRKGQWIVKVKTEAKRMRRKLKEVGEWCRANRHRPHAWQQAKLRSKVEGHSRYYGVSHNMEALKRFESAVQWVWRKWMNRRGSRPKSWEKWRELVGRYPWVKLRIVHSLWGVPMRKQSMPELPLW